MATLEALGFDSLEQVFREISEIPWSVTEDALDAMAETAMPKIRGSGESMGVRDPESEVHILDKLKRNKAKQTDSGGYETVTFSGTRTRHGTRTRNAEIAFINEYGKRGQPARPFMARALDANQDAILGAAEQIVGDWIENEWNK